MKNRIPLIVAGLVIIVLIIIAYLGMSGTLIQEGTTTTENSKTIVPGVLTNPYVTREGTPSPVLLEQLKSYNFRIRDSGINKWEFGPNTNEITLYVYDIHNQSQIEDLQGTQIGNYTIRIIHDNEFERIRDDVAKNLTLLRNDSRYQISHFSMGTDAFGNPPGYYAEVWVYELNQENRNLENTIIKGWKILVYPVSSPSVTTQTPKNNSSSDSP